MKYFFEYKINPVSVNHYWEVKCVKGKPLFFYKKEGAFFRDFIKWNTIAQCKKKKSLPLFKKPLKIAIHIEYFYKKRPKDIDNILKALLDSFEGILFENDSQIIELFIRKQKGEDYLLKVSIEGRE